MFILDFTVDCHFVPAIVLLYSHVQLNVNAVNVFPVHPAYHTNSQIMFLALTTIKAFQEMNDSCHLPNRI
jgi:hypothetical protein